eukprot:m.126297 g.126297  ORF g.126297 m.126297 type:complete len:280 (+) comp37894_c0_seq29:793-1632(+)
MEAALRDYNIPMEVHDAHEMKRRFPQVKFKPNVRGIMEDFAGILKADLARESIQDLFVKVGGVIETNQMVVDIQPGSLIKVCTAKRDYFCHKLVLTVGPWASKLLKPLGLELPLVVSRARVFYWKTTEPDIYKAGSFPIVSFNDLGGSLSYAMPVLEYPGLFKYCCHDGTKVQSPDERDSIKDDSDLEFMKGLVRDHFRGLSESPAIIENCLYTSTPDEDFILDCHPVHRNIVIGAGFSGHGFKLAPVVGQILADLAMGRTSKYDMEPFAIKRFFKSSL